MGTSFGLVMSSNMEVDEEVGSATSSTPAEASSAPGQQDAGNPNQSAGSSTGGSAAIPSQGPTSPLPAATMPKSGATVADSNKIGVGAIVASGEGDSVMASVGTVGSVSISLHPLVILNISEHWTRTRAQEGGKPTQVVGAIIGIQTGRHIEIMNSFELMIDVLDGNIIINREYYALKEEQFKQVFSEMDLLGWYTTGDNPGPLDMLVHKQICDLLDSPIFLKLNPLARCTDLPVTVYESVLDIVNSVPTLMLVELTYTLATEEAERIGIDHVARMSSHEAEDNSIVAENLQAQYSAIKMLASRVRLIAEYVRASQRGEVPFNHDILREINALAHRLPVLSSDKFRGDFYNQCNDVALMSYLGTITKCCNTMNRFINRFNLLHERLAMGRRMRGLFF